MAFSDWANRKLSEERQARQDRPRWATLRNRAAYKERMQELSKQYEESGGAVLCEPLESDDEGVGQTYEDRIGTCLNCCSSEQTPLTTPRMQREADEVVAPYASGRTGGLTRYSGCRDVSAKKLIVKDIGALPATQKYEVRRPCCVRHTDIC